ncbi:hypothetical protein B0H13DRAFT_1915026 [Mycena leptocephala]|nr:hypothetical protein B0H13DRAFT_1915026 [Mycena leptocephala]
MCQSSARREAEAFWWGGNSRYRKSWLSSKWSPLLRFILCQYSTSVALSGKVALVFYGIEDPTLPDGREEDHIILYPCKTRWKQFLKSYKQVKTVLNGNFWSRRVQRQDGRRMQAARVHRDGRSSIKPKNASKISCLVLPSFLRRLWGWNPPPKLW